MPSNRALIIDRNERFRDLAHRVLQTVGIEPQFEDNGKAGLHALSEREPVIVLLAVEKPKKRGFALFTQIKNMTKKLPVAIVTSTVPMEELLLHQKHRLHADAYLDKRDLDEERLLRALNGLLELKLDSSELSELAVEAALKGKQTRQDVAETASTGGHADDVDDLTSTLKALESLVTEPGDSVDPAEGSDEPSRSTARDDEEAARLREEVESLRVELDAARRSAGSSPFSDEYLELSEKAGRADRQMARLQAQLDSRAEEASGLERKLTAAARKLVDEERARREAVERAEAAETELHSLERDLRNATERATDLEARLAQAREAERAAALEHDAALAAIETRLAGERDEALERARGEHEATLERVRREHAAAVAELRSAHEQETDELRTAHQRIVARKKEQVAELLAERDEEHTRALERLKLESAAALQQAEEELRCELKAATEERAAHLEVAESKRRSDLAEIEARHRADMGKAQEGWQRDLEKQRSEHRDELLALENRYRSRIDGLEKEKAVADELAHRQAVKAAEAYDALMQEKQETLRLRAKLREDVDRLHGDHARERRMMEQEQAKALESLAEKLRGREKAESALGSSSAPEPAAADPQLLPDLLDSVRNLDELDHDRPEERRKP